MNSLNTLPDSDTGPESESDSKPDGYIVISRAFLTLHNTDSDLDVYSCGSHFSGLTKFRDFSSIFSHFSSIF